MLTVLLAVRHPPAPQWVGTLLRFAAFMQPWSMNEVMLLGILVALIKIATLADVSPGVGIFSVGVLILLLAAIAATFDRHEVWTRVQWADGTLPPAPPSDEPLPAGAPA
jgi:paraquat-inducible protein A